MGADRSLQILNVALFVVKSDGERMKSVGGAGTASPFLFINGGLDRGARFHRCSAVNKRKP